MTDTHPYRDNVSRQRAMLEGIARKHAAQARPVDAQGKPTEEARTALYDAMGAFIRLIDGETET